MSRLVFFGECMVEFRRDGGELWRQDFAGDTYNTALYLARLDKGAEHIVEYACGVGDDPFAAAMVEAWHRQGVRSTYTRKIAGRPTGLYTIAVDAQGERSFAYWRDTSAARAYFDCPPPTPLEWHAHEIDVFYLSGISLAILPPAGVQRVLELCDAVRSHGGRVVFDNNYRPRLWPSAADAARTFQACLAKADIALITLDDQAAVTGVGAGEQLVANCLALPVPELVIKQGHAPTLVRLSGQAVEQVPTESVVPVDTTAAGDSFAAGYLWARLAGKAPAAAAALGNALAARVIQHPGALMPADVLDNDEAFWRLAAN